MDTKIATRADVLNPRCPDRSRLGALRDGVEASVVRLFAETPSLPGDSKRVQQHGVIPETDQGKIDAINKLRPAGTPNLGVDDVWIHVMEAGNTNLVDDRWMFLGVNTLKNTAKAGARGFAFMNSHQTGGLSSPAQLPFGRTFAGQYEQWKATGDDGVEREYRRALLGVYMLRGQKPNGDSGPSTDAIHNGIMSGTIFDVSLGFGRDAYYQYICDVCGRDMDSYEVDDKGDKIYCRHVPGTHYKMSQDEIDAQLARGIPFGYATYTFENATPGEISAVYDGAVPGAGFRKAIAFARSGRLGEGDLKEVLSAYGRLARPGLFEPRQRSRVESSEDDLTQFAQAIVDSGLIPGLTFQPTEVSDDPPETKIQRGEPVPEAKSEPTTLSPEAQRKIDELSVKLAAAEAREKERADREQAEREEAAKQRERFAVRDARKAANTFAEKVCGKPGDKDSDPKKTAEFRSQIAELHFALGRIDRLSPVLKDGSDEERSLAEEFEVITQSSAPVAPFREVFGSGKGRRLPSDLSALPNEDGDDFESDIIEEANKDGAEFAKQINAKIRANQAS